MGKKGSSKPAETCLDVPQVPSLVDVDVTPICDTHTHLHSTFSAYRGAYPAGRYENITDFVKGFYGGPRTASNDEALPTVHVPVKSIVDVWCEAPILSNEWKELADSALTEESRAEKWGDVDYWFVMERGRHEARNYNDEVEAEIKGAMKHPRNVGWGEIGLDYHYDNSPREIQREVLIRQLKCAVELGKPLTIHTREANDDIYEILTTHVPKEWKIHIHCFTDAVDLAERLLAHFPNLYIGITGVITYATNLNTAQVVRNLVKSNPSDPKALRIVLETDAPYMVPSNLTSVQQKAFGLKSNARMPLCHTGMIPWTAEFVATVANQGLAEQVIQDVESRPSEEAKENSKKLSWTAEEVMRVARENAKAMYGI
ncbi:TatD DNase family protein [Ceratobasidium sp. AG-Ba]|nr:TatD DNase family protein [Ceratobasidium sp. AG-Ba]